MELTVTKRILLPDPIKLARLARAPELGPRILFFSGGSALGPLSRRLISYSHNSIHLITPFDSGGSSAELRRAFSMPAVGDLRNRMMSLAEASVTGNPQIRDLFSHRLPQEPDQRDLLAQLESLISGEHELITRIMDPMRKIIRTHLSFFRRAMPADFNLAGASVGNLVLCGGYLNNGRHLDPVVYLFSRLAEVRGVVRPIINKNLHLAAELVDGRVIIGQHLITGRTAPPLTSPITRLTLSASDRELIEARPVIRDKTAELIASADLICYPIGSFYTSLLANLLPAGVARAIAANPCPKVFIPNSLADPEVVEGSVQGLARTLLDTLTGNGENGLDPARLLNYVLLDSRSGDYPGRTDLRALTELGLEVLDTRLTEPETGPRLDPDNLLAILLSLV